MKTIAAIAALFTVAFATPALAQTSSRDKGEVSYERKTTIVFGEGDEVVGEFARPGDDITSVRRTTRFPSLLKARANFIPEMLKLAESL